MTDSAHLPEDVHQTVAGGFLCVLGLAGGLLFEFLIGIGLAPLGLGFRGVAVQLGGIEGGKVHGYHSCFLNLTGVGNEPFQMRLSQFQQMDLPVQGIPGIVTRGIQNGLDVLQGEFQFPQQQDLMQPGQGRIVIQPVACFRHPGGAQEPDGIIVVECAHTHTGELADFVDCFHPNSSRLPLL